MTRRSTRGLKRLSLVLCFVTTACTTTASENVKTSGLWAFMRIAHSQDDSVEIDVQFRVGGSTGTHALLSGGDHVEVNGEPIKGEHDFVARASDDVYDVALVRSDETVTTILSVPSYPAILAPAANEAIQHLDPLAIEWDNTSSAGYIQGGVVGPCIGTMSFIDLQDTGAFTTAPLTSVESCELELTLVRIAGFSVNSHYDSGRAEAVREAAIPLSYVGIGP